MRPKRLSEAKRTAVTPPRPDGATPAPEKFDVGVCARCLKSLYSANRHPGWSFSSHRCGHCLIIVMAITYTIIINTITAVHLGWYATSFAQYVTARHDHRMRAQEWTRMHDGRRDGFHGVGNS